MIKVAEISAGSFEKLVKESGQPVVIEFWMRSCSYCQKFAPIYEKLPATFDDKVTFLKVNMLQSLENLKLAEGLGVEDTPTLKLFCRGREAGEIIRPKTLDITVRAIKAILEREEYCKKRSTP